VTEHIVETSRQNHPLIESQLEFTEYFAKFQRKQLRIGWLATQRCLFKYLNVITEVHVQHTFIAAPKQCVPADLSSSSSNACAAKGDWSKMAIVTTLGNGSDVLVRLGCNCVDFV
jgi:hypothetical protein